MNGIGRFAVRHLAAILVLAVVGGWTVFIFPQTPGYAVLMLKRSVDARNGNRAVEFIDFTQVVKHAGYEMIEGRSKADPLAALVGKTAVELLSAPMAGAAETWVRRQVDAGAEQVQMPLGAVAAAIAFLSRDGDQASVDFKDRRGRVWKIRMRREADGVWRITEIGNIRQLLDELSRRRAPGRGIP